jgi:hypothetical protein
MNTFSNVKWTYKTFIELLCANNEHAENMLENNSIHNRLKKNQNYLGINLTKEVKDLFSENHKILKK